MATNSDAFLAELHNLLNRYFNMEEMRNLCLRLGIDYETISGQGKPAWIRELLLSLGRSGRLPELVALAQKERPHAAWPPLPEDFQLPVPIEASSSPHQSVSLPLRSLPAHNPNFTGRTELLEQLEARACLQTSIQSLN